MAPDVSGPQLARISPANVFAVTRSIEEARLVVNRRDPGLVWGCGVHPGLTRGLAAFDERAFRDLVDSFALVGEVGLDRRRGKLPDQVRVLGSILVATARSPVMVSLHSAGYTRELVQILAEHPQRGAILHWFLGDRAAVQQALALGCYFSVNGAMPDQMLRQLPVEKVLPETDFPASGHRGGASPGDIGHLEVRLGHLFGLPADQLRRQWYRNLRSLAVASGAIERLPEQLADSLLAA